MFLEHGPSDDPEVRAWQRRLNPIEAVLADGCRLDLDIEAVVRRKPFRRVEVERVPAAGLPMTYGTMSPGSALK